MPEPETYCLCKCLICGEEFHEWIELYTSCTVIVDCWCPACERFVGAKVIPADLHYVW